MKISGVLWLMMAGLFGSFSLLHAQALDQTNAPDSIVQFTADQAGLELLSPELLPRYGTFWVVTSNGLTAPYPCLPNDSASPVVYSIADGQFLVDDTSGQVNPNVRLSPFLPRTNSVSTALDLLASSVNDLISQIQETQFVQEMAMAFGLDVPTPGDGDSGTNSYPMDSFGFSIPDYGTNLWIAQVSITNGYLAGIGTNTETDIQYEIQSRTNLAQTDWQSEGFIWGSELTNWTPLSVAQNGRTNLFIRLRSWIDTYDIGIPDWWQFQYFGTNGINPDASAAGDGYSNFQKFQMGLVPTNYYNPNSLDGFFGSLDASGTNVILSWNRASGSVVNYLIQRGVLNTITSHYDYTPITVNSNAVFYKDVGAINNSNALNDIYTVTAVYPGSASSATNSWRVSWYFNYASYGSPYGPPLPNNVYAHADATGTNILLSWNLAAGPATNYLILRGIFNTNTHAYNYSQIASFGTNITSLADIGAITNNNGWNDIYEVVAASPGGGLSYPATSRVSYPVNVSINTGADTNAPLAPANFFGYTDSTETDIRLNWSSASGAVTNYIIYGGKFNSYTFLREYRQIGKPIAGTNSFTVVDAVGVYDAYSIVAVYTNGNLSQSALWYPTDDAPAPVVLNAYLDETGTNAVLAWTPVQGGVTGYTISRSDDSGYDYSEITSVVPSTNAYTDIGGGVAIGDGDLSSIWYQVQATYPDGGKSAPATAMLNTNPPAATDLAAAIDSTSTNVLLTWTPAVGNVSYYAIRRGVLNQTTGAYTYTQIGTASATTHSYQVVGAITGVNSRSDVYDVVAVYPGGRTAHPASVSLINAIPESQPSNLEVSAQMVRNQTGRWQLMFSSIPTNVQSVLLDWCYYDYFYDLGPETGFFSFNDYVYSEVSISAGSLTNGVYVIPDWQTTNLIPDNASGFLGYIRVVKTDGTMSDPLPVGFLRYDAACFVDGRQHLKQNLLHQLRAATISHPNVTLWENNVWFDPFYTSITIPVGTNYVESSFFHWSFMFKGYNSSSVEYMKMDDLWPLTVNYQLHQSLFDTNYTGPSAFTWSNNLVTVPAPAVLGISTPYWVSQLALSYYIDPSTGLPLYSYNSTNLAELAAYTGSGNLYLQSGVHNLFGLSFATALVNSGSGINPITGLPLNGAVVTLAPGGSVSLTNANVFYSQTAAPSLTLTNYYFAPVNTPGTALAGEAAQVQTYPLPSQLGFANTNQTKLLVASVGQPVVIGSWAKFAIQGSSTKFAYLGQYYNTNAFIVTNGVVTTNTTGIVSPYGDFFPTEPGAAAMITMPDIDTGATGTGIVRVVSLNVDANHDGTMDFKYNSPDFVSQTKPFRFWINDNQDVADFGGNFGVPGVQMLPDAIPGQMATSIHGRRDLVDFFPVCINIQSVLQAATNTTVLLKQADSALYFLETDLSPTNYMNFLRDTNFLPSLETTVALGIGPSGRGLTQAFRDKIKNEGKGIILVEVSRATQAPLIMELWQGTNKISQTSLALSITGVEQMFRHKNLLLSASPAMPDRLTDADVPNEPDTIDKNFVFLHGYNVLPSESRGTGSDMFKRMYWAGSHAKFYAVTWEGADSKGSRPFYNLLTPNYHTNVGNAFQIAPTLANFIATLTNIGPVVVSAHSLGNMLTLSAISDWNAPISQYFMLDAAVPIEAIDPTAITNMMIFSTWTAYSSRLFASDWYQLFPTNDARSTLSWNNRLGNLHNVDLYNFYSSGEEVLRTSTNDPPSSVLNKLLTQATYHFWDGYPFGSFTWYWQEKGKGTCSQDWFLGSSHGGWKFNSYYDRDIFGTHMFPADTAQVWDTNLKTNAFFDWGTFNSDLSLELSIGSTYAATNRNRILADAIPAMSLVAGANPVPRLAPLGQPNKNIDMMTLENGWSQGRSGSEANMWHHSDFVQMAYTFTYKLFDQFVTIGNLK